MQDPALDTLFVYLQKNPDLLRDRKSSIFLKARLHPGLKGLQGHLRCFQSYKPFAAALEGAGYEVIPGLPTERYCHDLCLLLPGRHKEENFYNFALALNSVREGGIVLCSMENEIGASRFEKALGSLASNIESYSKNRCRVFWCTKSTGKDEALLAEWLNMSTLSRNSATGFFTRPGLFAWDKIDTGSRLLSEFLPDELQGAGADLGAGYGYLCSRILRRCPQVSSIHLVEADFLALEAARLNIAEITSPAGREFHWHDATRGLPVRNLDWAVSNPPFHIARKAEPELGKAFIRSAYDALKKGGRFYMVANIHLPYDILTRELFADCELLGKSEGFKVIRAIK